MTQDLRPRKPSLVSLLAAAAGPWHDPMSMPTIAGEGRSNPVNRRKKRRRNRVAQPPAKASPLKTIRLRHLADGSIDPDHLNEIASRMDPKTLRRIRRKTGGNRYRHMLSRSHFG